MSTRGDRKRAIRRSCVVDGRSVSYTAAGRGAPVVLVHAAPFTAESWMCQVAIFARRYLVIALDLSGPETPDSSGGSSPGPARHAEEIAAVVKDAGLCHFALVAAGTGGLAALAYVLRWPSAVVRLVLVNVPLRPSNIITTLRQTAEGDPIVFAKSLLRHIFCDDCPPTRALCGVIQAALLAIISRPPPDVIASLDMADASVDAGLETIRTPTLILFSGRDALSGGVSGAFELRQRISAATIVEIPGAGAAPYLTFSRVFAKLVLAFLCGKSKCGACSKFPTIC